MSTPRVSVVMTTYNGARFLSEAIESILNQSLISLELIVVDDGSIDSSPSVIRSFCARDLRVRGIFLERNLGIPKAANYGLRAARGEYIARMDSDDMCHRDRLLKQVSHLDKHKEIQLLGCHFRAVDEEGFLCSDAYARYRKLKEPLPLSFGRYRVAKDILNLKFIAGFRRRNRTRYNVWIEKFSICDFNISMNRQIYFYVNVFAFLYGLLIELV